MKNTRIALGLSVCALAGLGLVAFGQPGETRGVQPNSTRNAQPGGPDIGKALIEGLLQTPGCLGADAAQFKSGKNAIFAWFKDKAAAEAWYYSPMHKSLMKSVGATVVPKPMEHIEEGTGPILIIAAITPSAEQKVPGFPAPISQISIELFAPLPGGAYVNGRLSPDAFEVPHMKNLSEEAEEMGG